MSSSTPLRLAIWSGPRNISTAMMRSWGNRSDTFVCDEPFYAHYLHATRKPHPGIDEVIAAGETDWRKVVAWLTGPVPEGNSIFFQKQMTHHLLPHISRDWLGEVTNCFLIRHPRDVLRSYTKIVDKPTAEDAGFPQQSEIFDWVCRHTGKTPPVIDAVDVRNRPREILGALCDAVGVTFQESMLSWSPGLRPTDGAWAKYWYKEVETSTCFRPIDPNSAPAEPLPDWLNEVYEQCLEFYEKLYARRIT